ncbi:hypothetical protein HDZ31DRAFT_85373 [Schizophyllum fasciatum]
MDRFIDVTRTVTLAGAVSLASLALGFVVGKSETEAEISRKVAAGSFDATSGPKDADPEPEDQPQEIPDGDLAAVKPGLLEPCKLVLVVRTDLKLPSGKIAERCGVIVPKSAPVPDLVHLCRQAKIALKGSSQKQLEDLERFAKGLNICARAIKDE